MLAQRDGRVPGRFRILVLLTVMILAALLYCWISRERLDSGLIDAMRQEDAAAVHDLLQHGANANAVIGNAPAPNLMETFLARLTNRPTGGNSGTGSIGAYSGITGSSRRQGLLTSALQPHSLLIEAAAMGNAAIMADLIAHRADVNSRTENGDTAVILCSRLPRRDCLRILLNSHALVNVRNEEGQTPLQLAARSGWVPNVDILLRHGADVQARDRSGETPLRAAAGIQNPQAVLLLLNHGAAPADLKIPSADPPLVWAAAKGHMPLLRTLWQKVLSPTERKAQVSDALFEAVKARNFEAANYLLGNGGSPNYERKIKVSERIVNMNHTPGGLFSGLTESRQVHFERATTLMAAAAKGDARLCALLLSHGADPNLASSNHQTPLMAAIAPMSMPSIISGAGLGARGSARGPGPTADQRFRSELHSDQYRVARLLINSGADVNAVASDGSTPLLLSSNGAGALLELLLSRGARVEGVDLYGRTPLIVACECGNSRAVERLIAAGANVNARDASGRTPLMSAVFGVQTPQGIEVVRLLLKHGATPNDCDKQGHRVLALASQANGSVRLNGILTAFHSNPAVCAILKKAGAH